MKCKLCGREKKLINSHIIPKSFFMTLYPKNNRESLVLIDEEKMTTKRRPVGVYDKNILCGSCDNLIGFYDSYAKDLLLDSKLKFYPNIKKTAYLLKDIDYIKLKLFFISLLWRASISGMPEFSKIDTGPFEKKLKNMILRKDPGSENEFSVVIGKFDSKIKKIKKISKKIIQTPYRDRIDNEKGLINCCIFYLSRGYKVFIKVDRRDLSGSLKKIILKNNGNLIILRFNNYEKSEELLAASRTIKKIFNNS